MSLAGQVYVIALLIGSGRAKMNLLAPIDKIGIEFMIYAPFVNDWSMPACITDDRLQG